MLRLTLTQARRLAVSAQLLAAGPPPDLGGTVERLGFLQLDPTAVVARTEHLVLWSRLGERFAPADLDRHTYADRSLFEYRAFLYPRAHYPLLRHAMASWAARPGPWQRRANAWLEANPGFRAHVLAELERRGPLRSRELEDRAAVPWRSDGWNDGRSLGQMLEFLAAQGLVAVSGREGGQRLWDLAGRVFPQDLPEVPADAAARELARLRLRALGIARPRVAGGAGEPATVAGVRGEWRVEPGLLDLPFTGRAALLSPFDRLVHDRDRLLALFDFDYRLEIYVPRARRRWGYYVLPALFGDRLVARVDARLERERDRLLVPALHVEPGAGAEALEAVNAELADLAAWLGVAGVEVERVLPAR